MKIRQKLIALCTLSCLLGCGRSESDYDAAGPTSEIDAMIEQLAISDEKAGFDPIDAPSKDAPKTDKRIIAFEAAEQLKKFGKRAFPDLMKHLGDERQSVALRRVLPSTVGDACFCIIRHQVFNLPDDYQGSLYRTGADGESHARPYFQEPTLFESDTVESWLKAREQKTLEQIQTEALGWLIEQENYIGFREEEDKEKFLYPLERQLDKIKR